MEHMGKVYILSYSSLYMEIKNLQRKKRAEKKISISIRVSKEISNWLRKENISPTKLFVNAVEPLMKKE